MSKYGHEEPRLKIIGISQILKTTLMKKYVTIVCEIV
jgi:hypothetical protein